MCKYVFVMCMVLCAWIKAEPVEIFTYSKDKNKGYRIPALVTSKKGTLLAFAEQRVGLHDHAENDIVLRRSIDNGRTWKELQVLHDDGGNSLNDPCAAVLNSGRIILVYQRFPKGVHARKSSHTVMAENGYDGPKNTRTFIIHSDDDGLKWSKPRDITRQARRNDRISVGSPGQGIQITRGEYKGRIIIPFYEVRRLSDTKRDWNNSCMYSDDNGENWTLSQAIPHPSTLKGFGNEAQLVELKDGSLLFNARNQGGKYRKVSHSKDGGKTWTEMKIDEGLPGIHCMGSVLRYSWPESGESIIIYSGPASKKGRTNGTLRLSYDEGKTWKDSLEMASPYYGYSCLTKTADGRIGVIYETDGCRKIKFSLLTIDQIKAAKK